MFLNFLGLETRNNQLDFWMNSILLLFTRCQYNADDFSDVSNIVYHFDIAK